MNVRSVAITVGVSRWTNLQDLRLVVTNATRCVVPSWYSFTRAAKALVSVKARQRPNGNTNGWPLTVGITAFATEPGMVIYAKIVWGESTAAAVAYRLPPDWRAATF